MTIEYPIFILLSLANIWISRRSFMNTRSHGFYRFFAWEAILALILLNLNLWFYQPFSWRQLISWPLLAVSLFLVIHTIQVLRLAGKPGPVRGDESLISIERTTNLVTSGAYRYIRHPLYTSLLCLTWGAFLKDITWFSAALALGATVFLILTARIEEVENLRYFGTNYLRYMKRSRMFIPFLV